MSACARAQAGEHLPRVAAYRIDDDHANALPGDEVSAVFGIVRGKHGLGRLQNARVGAGEGQGDLDERRAKLVADVFPARLPSASVAASNTRCHPRRLIDSAIGRVVSDDHIARYPVNVPGNGVHPGRRIADLPVLF